MLFLQNRRIVVFGTIGIVYLLCVGLLPTVSASEAETTSVHRTAIYRLTDVSDVFNSSTPNETILPIKFQEELPLKIRPGLLSSPKLPGAAQQVAAVFLKSPNSKASLLADVRRARARRPTSSFLLGGESKLRLASDTGSLLGKSRSILGVGIQKRNPIITDTRPRSSRVGSTSASGSYWVPARIDLDTFLSKIDARIINDVIVIKGPYSTIYGPGFNFVDVELLPTPRFQNGYETHARSSVDFKTNGEQWSGRQSFWGGDDKFGFRIGYGHRTGNDYETGDDTGIPSSFKSRDVDLALGYDLSDHSRVEFSYLRLDQTDVEFPGQAFDIDFLVTNAYDLTYILEDADYFDRLDIDVWHNKTRFEGSAQRAGKRRQFPFYDFIRFVGNTDVNSASSGFRVTTTWGGIEDGSGQVTAGVDLRHIKQELNEIASGTDIFTDFTDVNSPIPRSQSVNPGFFVEATLPSEDERLIVRVGARADVVATDITDNPAKLASVTPLEVPIEDIYGTDAFDQNFSLGAVFLTTEYQLNPQWTANAAFGYAQQAPNLTKLYVAESFMFLLQNGLNTVIGDPRLDPEQLWQIDAGIKYETTRFIAGVNGFHSWIQDYITFENVGFSIGPPFGQPAQVFLKYVNTNRATMAGFEFFSQFDLTDSVRLSGSMSYVDGRDHTRNGNFATMPAGNVVINTPSTRVPGIPRGSFSGFNGDPNPTPGSAQEPLPSIVPLETRLSILFHDPDVLTKWAFELSTRIVQNQDRLATSLMESRTPGFTTWDCRAFWQVNESLMVVLGVENLTDKNYREHLDFRSQDGLAVFQTGRNFYFGSELTY